VASGCLNGEQGPSDGDDAELVHEVAVREQFACYGEDRLNLVWDAVIDRPTRRYSSEIGAPPD
jgi:hypothetical protein